MSLMTIVQQPYDATLQQWRGSPLIAGVAIFLIALMIYASWRIARTRKNALRERDKAQQEITRYAHELSTLVNSVQALVFRTDSKGTLRFVNSRWHVITNQPAEKAEGKHLRDVVHADCRDQVDTLFNTQQSAGVRRAQVHLTDAGRKTRLLDVSVVPLCDKSGQVRGFVGSAVDVTALLAGQHSLQEELAIAHQLVDCAPAPICMTDLEGRILLVNPAWEHFMKRSRASVLGLRNSDFLPLHEAQAYSAYNEQLLREGGQMHYDERLRRPDGTYRDIRLTKGVVTSRQHQPIGILTVKMDITEVLAVRDLAEEISRSKSEFVANISHELRTPLQSIIGFSELGLLRSPQGEQLVAMFSNIHGAGQRMLMLVNELLDIAKIESAVGAFHFERTDVRDLIEDVAAEMALLLDKKRLNLGLHLGRAPLVAKVDPSRFKQVVRNLMSNAVKFSPEEGSIEITANTPDEHTIHIQTRDQGPGIPPAELESIFQPFVQSSQTRDVSGGTGLGLAISRKIIMAHGGRIHAANAPGAGTIFHIVLPAATYTDTMPAPLS